MKQNNPERMWLFDFLIWVSGLTIWMPLAGLFAILRIELTLMKQTNKKKFDLACWKGFSLFLIPMSLYNLGNFLNKTIDPCIGFLIAYVIFLISEYICNIIEIYVPSTESRPDDVDPFKTIEQKVKDFFFGKTIDRSMIKKE